MGGLVASMNLPRIAQTLDYTCGAACFESMFQYYKGFSLGEMYFANELETLKLGYTPPVNIVTLAKNHGFSCDMMEGAIIPDLIEPFTRGKVIFVTWCFENAGHYSLVKCLDREHITLMDPWCAREGMDNRLTLKEFVPYWQARGSRIIKVF